MPQIGLAIVIIRPCVVWVQYQPSNIPGVLVPIDPDDGVGVLPAPNHDWGAVGGEMIGQIPALQGQLLPGVHWQGPAIHLQGLTHDTSHLLGSNPLLGAHKLGLLAIMLHQTLLDLWVSGDFGAGVALEPEPTDEGLQGPVKLIPF